MAELRVPKLNNNDTEYLLVEWLVPDGATVHEDDAVVLMETSKAAEELPADTTGVIRHRVKPGTWCRPDEIIATIGSEPAPATGVPASGVETATPASTVAGTQAESAGPMITAPAQMLIDELGITPEQVASLGVRVVRRADVERLMDVGSPLDTGPPADGAREEDTTALDEGRRQALPRVQRAVARAVEVSHQTIPAAYLVVRMDLAPALDRARTATKLVRRPVGVAEIFVQAVAGLHERFPMFFAALQGTHAIMADAPHLGVTVDLGEGLYVPVVHDAAGRTLKEIAGTLMKHRLAATAGEFKEADLTGANFVITLHTDGDVVMAIPFVFPGTSCALAVTAPADGSPALIGLAYDHRLINGRDAALFLAALRTAVESWDAA